MQLDFHYYATYCAAYLAGYSREESLSICQSAQFVDRCTATLLTKLKAPRAAATTQLPLEMMENSSDRVGRENITRIWSSFHFLPYDLYAAKKRCGKRYLDKYRLICQPNSDLVVETVKLAKGGSLQAVGVAMHVLADTWAHRNFAGTPSLVINNTNYHFYELLSDGEAVTKRKIKFIHSAVAKDDFENGVYVNSLYQASENAVMNIGHGRAGHLPDYSFARYQYLPAWADYEEITKDNPKEYYLAFCQMVYALRYLRGETQAFEKETYDFETVEESAHTHDKRFRMLVEQLREKGTAFLPLGAGPCMLCAKCTYPDAPCRLPDKMVVSMEASGLVVNDVCTMAGIPYNHGTNTISFTGCILY